MSEQTGRVLVACPTYAGKEYALDAWIEHYRALNYEPKSAYQVDNTRLGKNYFELIKSKGIDCTYLEPWPDWDRTFLRCWQLILERAQKLDCYWIYSVEADNTPAPESLETMVTLALLGKCHLVTHAYPMHKTAAEASGLDPQSWYYHELGCMLVTRSLLERAIRDYDDYGNIAHAIFSSNDRYHGGHIKLTNCFKVGHLDGYQMSFTNLAPSEKAGLICPTPQMPADFGSQLPPCLQNQKAA